jgi:hypothetical protein
VIARDDDKVRAAGFASENINRDVDRRAPFAPARITPCDPAEPGFSFAQLRFEFVDECRREPLVDNDTFGCEGRSYTKG